MQQAVARPLIAATAALVTAGSVAVTPVPGGELRLIDVALAAGEVITLDLVRHGQSVDNVDGILGTVPPGAPLTVEGQLQADAVATAINTEFGGQIAGVYASQLIRTQETADPLASLLTTHVQILPGLNELNAGFLEGQPLNAFTEIGYVAAPLAWILGNYWVPQLGSTVDPNGVAFDDRVSEAIAAIYANTVGDPVNPLTDVAFSHAGTIAVWTLMNVKNPDFGLVLNELIGTGNPVANTGQVVLQGNPADGWTLVSWDGHDVAPTPDLFTALFVDWRDLVVAPQIAGWHIWQAIEGGDPAAISTAVSTGFDDVIAAIARFPQAVIDSVTAAFGAGGAGAAAADDAALWLGDAAAI